MKLVENITTVEPIVPDYDPDSSDIEVSLVGSSEVCSDHTDIVEEQLIMDPTLSMILLLLLMKTFLTGQKTLLT